MVPSATRMSHYPAQSRQVGFVHTLERVLPRSLVALEMTALYLLMGAIWGLVLLTVLTYGL